jgi:adenylosuccinate lyase
MKKNLNKLKGLPMSEGLMLTLTQKGLAREKAYKMIQKNAMVVWQTQEEFIDVLLKDNELKKYLSANEIKKILNLDHALRRTDQIFKKVFK